MAPPYSSRIPGLRSPFDPVSGIVYSGRILDKIRLSSPGQLPETLVAARGGTKVETLKEEKTDEMLARAFAKGRQSHKHGIEAWKAFMTRRSRRDASMPRLNERLAEIAKGPYTTAQAVAVALEEP